MKNEEIHREFTQQEIRDFLSQELEASRIGGGIGVKYIEGEIERFQVLLRDAKKYEAIIQIIEDKNWKEWEISEDIPYDRENYFPFIGTKEEYNKLMKILKKEENKNE